MSPLVVIDTNIWISGLFWDGLPFQILEKVYSGLLIPCFSSETFNEWSEKVKSVAEVTDKFGLYLREKKLLQKVSVFVSPTERVYICRDPKDNKFLEVTISAQTEFLISGDKDLVNLRKFRQTKIVTPKQFLKLSSKI